MRVPSVDHPTERPNFYRVIEAQGVFWFSYTTLIAFRPWDGELLIRKNDWGPTSGAHLNHINEDKSIRIDGKDFEEQIVAMGGGV